MPPSRLSPQDRRAILMQLNRDRLAELTLHFELEVSDRRAASTHIDAIVRKRSLDFRLVLEQLKREELQDICAVMGLGKGGREKAKLVARILGEPESAAASAEPADAGGAPQPPVEERTSGERALRVGPRDSEPPPSVPPPSGRAPATAADGALKSRLRKFVVRTAAEYLGRDAAGAFVTRLLQCFGWPEGGPRGLMSTEPEWIVHLAECDNETAAARAGGLAFDWLKRRLLPEVKSKSDTYQGWLERWWQPWRPRHEFSSLLSGKSRMIVCSNPQARPVFAFISTRFVPTNTLQVFALDDDYSFGILQSAPHWAWTKAKGGKVTERIRYTNEVWTTFPWPQEPTEAEVVAVAAAGRELLRVRDELTREHGLSLRAMYQAAEGAGPHPLKDAQAALDEAVRKAYSMPTGAEPTEFLLEMNKLVAEDEAEGRTVQGPGLPRGLDPRDPRWTSDDCIQPPKV